MSDTDTLRARLDAEAAALDAQIATCESRWHAAPVGCPYCRRDARLRGLLRKAATVLADRESTWCARREAQWKRENPMGSTAISARPVAVLEAEDAAVAMLRQERDA